MQTVQDAKIEGKKVLLRLDLNVPISNGKIISDKRIREAIPTIKYLLGHGAQEIIIITHLGKPKGKIDNKYSLWSIANRLAELLKLKARFSKYQECYHISNKVIMIENLRFNAGEEKNDPAFAKKLASYAELPSGEPGIFVNDAFGTMHRVHASTYEVAEVLPSYAGLLVQKEVENLEKILLTKEKPFTVILGGAKIADKLPVIKNLVSRADNFIVGGAIANTFLAARRHHMGKSLVEKDAYREANICWQMIMDEPDKSIYLPVDLVVSFSEKRPDGIKIVKTSELLNFNKDLEEYRAVDIGPKTAEQYTEVIKKSKVIFWNGNMGISEIPEFADGTINIAKAIRQLADKSDAQIVVGGGDTVAAVEKLRDFREIGGKPNLFLSTGGGATLEFLAGKVLPGLKVLGYY